VKEKQCIFVPGCESPEAPVSHAVRYGSLVFVSGQVGAELKSGRLHNDSIEDETAQALENVKQILEAAGASIDDVLKVTVFLTSMENFAEVNEVYKRYFPSKRPARSCVQVGLAKNYRVEIESIAYVRD
jgi:2-iminobutanoate/2-iminopropanoate deaminase